MTNIEFSNEFDVLVNSYSAIKPFGYEASALEFDEYEKSAFLTLAQEKIVTSLYNGTLLGKPFESTEELRRYLNDLIKTYSTDIVVKQNTIENDLYIVEIPEDVMFITYEVVKSEDSKLGCAKGTTFEVVPVTQDDLHKTIRNPFRGPNKRRVLRLDIASHRVELVSAYSISEYTMRYISKPDPIILTDLPEGLSINEITKETECKLNPAIHRVILETAVSLALKSRTSAGK